VFALGPKGESGGYYRRMYKARPGDKCSDSKCCYRDKPINFSSCSDLVSRIVCDNEKYVVPLRKNASTVTILPDGYHMMCAMLSPDDHKDFHFARRFKLTDLSRSDFKRLVNSTPEPAKAQLLNVKPDEFIWLHQRGWMKGGPICYDASNQLIRNVKTCNMNYGGLNYKKTCSFFKVKTRHATVTNEHEF
jgi:hypothetical protein